MAEIETRNQRKRGSRIPEAPRIRSDLGRIAMTVGFGAAITGLFSLGGILMTEWGRADEQRCSVAQQIVIDESPSPALNEMQTRRLGLLAMHALEQCLGEAS